MYVSSSFTLHTAVNIGNHITSSIFTEFLNPEAVQGLNIIMEKEVSPLRDVTKYLHLLSQFFIAVGILTLLLKRKEMKFKEEYATSSLINILILFGAVTVPFFASPNKLFEAMMYEKPILVSKGTTMTDIVEKENCGLAVHCNSVDEIRKAIIRLKDDPDLCRQLGANARRAYEERYNWVIMEQRLLAIYRELTGGRA